MVSIHDEAFELSISPVIRRAARFQDLLAIPGGDGPYAFTRMFREADRAERRQSRRHFKLLKRVDGAVREVVEPQERVLFLTTARGLSFWEQWVLGWRRVVVLTDSRVILLQLDAGRRPRRIHRQLAYAAIAEVTDRRSAGVGIETLGGETLELRGLRQSDRTVVTDRLRSGAKAKHGTSSATGVESLCPYCHKALSGRPRSCPRCLRDFRRGWLSALSSLAVPGLGDYLMGFRGFSILELLTALAIWSAYLVGPTVWGVPGVQSALGAGWIFAAVHGADAVLTWRVSRGGVFPSGEA